MLTDTDTQTEATRDPVAPARRSDAALAKAASHKLADGTPVHSFPTLLDELSTIVRNTCQAPGAAPNAPSFAMLTMPNAKQRRALELIEQPPVPI
jgi:hypothetical protein